MWTPVFISGIATGKLKTFGVITSSLNILQIVVCYIILKLGVQPVETILSLALWEIIAYSIQFFTLKKLIEFHFCQYALKVLFRAFIVPYKIFLTFVSELDLSLMDFMKNVSKTIKKFLW